MNESLTSSRSVMAPIDNPSGVCVGISLRLCTAISIRFSSNACSISRVKSPLSPIFDRGESRILSPVVLMMLSSTANEVKCLRSSPWTHCACQRARSLPRVPMTSRSGIMRFMFQSEKMPYRADFFQDFLVGGTVSVLQIDDRCMEYFIDNSLCQ